MCLACLSTPFITARLRPFFLGDRDQELKDFGGIVLFVFGLILYFVVATATKLLVPDALWDKGWVLAGLVLSWFILPVLVCNWLNTHIRPLWKPFVEQTYEQISKAAASTESCPLLVITNPRDEAAGVLIAIRFASWLVASPGRKWRSLRDRYEWVAEILGLGFLVLGSYYLGSLAGGLGKLLDEEAGVIADTFVGFFVLSWIFAGIGALLLGAHAVLYLALGRDAAIVAPYLDINVEAIPNGVSHAYLTSDPGGLDLAHSSVYDNPETWKELADWIPTVKQ
jgi:hypothetical protein